MNVRLGGLGSGPAAFTARTVKECWPSASAGVVYGELHGPNGLLSRLHSNVAAGSSEWNVNLAVVSVVVPDGPESIVVFGSCE